ncbi:hypothetical protein SNE40_012199 [Patella caerulea]|uniref:Poly [ADP-ribose] polymerase n=1 Tax=Patella caerulea TaxID=87958 RepID=A0AAN8JLA4_PATCE
MSDHHDLPFTAEYAKSDRSSCKACKSNISKGSLAIMVQSPHFDGKVPNWFHFACFWKGAKVAQPEDIHGFHSLRWDDQQKVKGKIGGDGGGGGDGDATGGGNSDATNCSTCRGFEDSQHHVDYFVDKKDELEFNVDIKQTTGSKSLKKEDQEGLVKKLGGAGPAKNRKGDTKSEAPAKNVKMEETEEEKQLREQSALIWKYRDLLINNVSIQAMKLMLELNEQNVPPGESKLLDAMSDCLTFGALERCPECKEGQFYYTNEGYKCSGNMTAWTNCMNIIKNPQRKAFKVPKEFHDVEFLKKYKYVPNTRIFPVVKVSAIEGPVRDSVDGVLATDKPLDQMKFVIIGKTKKSKAVLTKEISNLGGTVVSKPDGSVAACISTKNEVDEKSKGIKEAEKADVHVVSEDFLEDLKAGEVVAHILKHSLSTWGSDPATRIGDIKPKTLPKKSAYKSGMNAKEEAMFTKSVPTKKKMTVKGGAAVDPDSELEDVAHVIEERGSVYSAVLSMVDIVKGTNSYYILQALEKDNGSGWYLFRSWGRTNTTIGGNKCENQGSRAAAINSFKTIYADKTNNDWDNRANFEKFPNKYSPLDIDDSRAGSKLPKSVQDVICAIFDIDQMNKAMVEFEIDLKKMPLGILSRSQIETAYSVLAELDTLIDTKGSQNKFLDASNRFYTLIPHDFGMKKPPLLDTPEIIKLKTEMLDNLLDIEVGYSLLEDGDEGANAVDAHYKKLKCSIEPMKKSDMYDRLVKYVENTHTATHSRYSLQVEDIFEIKREGEEEKYQPFKDFHNRQLLWHGSRTTNYAGILSQGLRIAPPDAPVSGYLFGKGVYFADMVSKSADYCRASKTDSTA